MLKNLAEYIIDLPLEKLSQLPPEDIALCSSWHKSQHGSKGHSETYGKLPEQVDKWCSNIEPVTAAGNGRRQQPFIRVIVDQLQAADAKALSGDQLAFVVELLKLLGAIDDSGVFDRIRSLLEPYSEAIKTLHESTAATPGLKTIEAQINFVTAEEIRRSKPKKLSLFKGDQTPSLGPVYLSDCALKVIGSIPEDCSVVVHAGSCVVGGYILGRLAVQGNCEARDNIVGDVVSKEGDIRANRIINNAVAISKWGGVYCTATLNPKIVFASREIVISDDAMMGLYISPTISIGKSVQGGELHVSKSLTGKLFQKTYARETEIVMRRSISSEEYGEEVLRESRALMSEIARMKSKASNISNMNATRRRDAEHCATSGILFLITGEETYEQIQEKQRLENRLSFLGRIITGITSLAAEAEGRMHTKKQGGDESLDAAVMTDDLADCFQGDEVDDDIASARVSLKAFGVELRANSKDTNFMSSAIEELHIQRDKWCKQQDIAQQRLSVIDADLESKMSDSPVGNSPSAMKGSRILLFQKLMDLAKKRSPEDKLAKNAQSPFIKFMFSNIVRNLSKERENTSDLQELDEQMKAIDLRLRREFHVFAPESSKENSIQISGAFDHGVKLFSDIQYCDESNQPEGSVLITPDSRGKTITYTRNLSRIVERHPHPDPSKPSQSS